MTIDITTISTWIDTIANAISIATAVVGTPRPGAGNHPPPPSGRDQGAHRTCVRWALARGRAPWDGRVRLDVHGQGNTVS
jgi:hypothetical protein